MKIDISDIFESGMLYVAMSRVKDLRNIEIYGYTTFEDFRNYTKPSEIAYDFTFNNKVVLLYDKMLI